MKIVKPKIEFINAPEPEILLKTLNRAARKCYQSEPNDQPDENLIRNIIKSGHTSVLEHEKFTFDLLTDRGVLAEITRHRMAGFSVESTRYCKYTNGEMEFIDPICLKDKPDLYATWKRACEASEKAYCEMMEAGAKAQEARHVLNNSLRVSMRVTMNIRSMRNFFYLRCDNPAHPHIKQIAIPMLLTLKEKYPVIFDNLRLEFDNADGMMKQPERYHFDWDKSFENEFMPDEEWRKYVTFKDNCESVSSTDLHDIRKIVVLEEEH